MNDWKRVVFSDETKVNLLGSDGRKWGWKVPGSLLQDSHVSPTVKYGGGSMMIWGCLAAKGIGNLVRIEGILNARLYIDILKNDLLGTLDRYALDKANVVFQHDNDPKHTAKITVAWLANKGIEILAWPPQSLDLNPIENLWAWFKFRLVDYQGPPSSIHEFWEHAQTAWNGFTEDDCIRLIESMLERIAAVISAKSSYTKF